MLRVKAFAVNHVQENTFIVHNTKNAILIDPGMYFENEFAEVENYLSTNNLTIVEIVCTHCHFDHVFALKWAVEKFNILPKFHEADFQLLQYASLAANKWNIEFKENYTGKFIAIDETSTLTLNDETFTILHIPGHSPGSIGFYNANNNFIVNGDVLFKNGYGRTDLPFCNEDDLFASIKNKLFTLPSNTIVYTGHGEPTTIGEEKARYNL
jgi:hydroxyacylglutathione hydrolase